MKIVQVCPRYHPHIGGVETHVREISERLVKRGFEVEVVCTDPSGKLPRKEVLNGIDITRFPSIAPKSTIFFSRSIIRYLKRCEYDIIHAHNYHALPAYFAALASRDNLVFTPHYHGKGSIGITNILLRPYKLLGRKIFEKAKVVICVSEYEKNLVLRDFHLEPSKIAVIPNGIDLEAIQKAEPYEFDGDLILYIGRLERYKHIDVVIRAMPLIPDAKFFIIGGAGNYRSELLGLVKQLGLEERVKFLGHVSDEEKYRWLKTCSLLVNLSDTEAFGITVLEALAAGKPVIVNPKSALGEFVGKFEGVYAIHVKKECSYEMINVLSNLVTVKMKMMDKNELKCYNWDSIIQKTIEVFINLNNVI
ncbi:MAG: glycosyltransferase family 4 protein [Methanomicrobiales archaeon]|nr:glycosyltransferase family 4 protein [Methanomicrobiales archaeon]